MTYRSTSWASLTDEDLIGVGSRYGLVDGEMEAAVEVSLRRRMEEWWW